MKSKTRKFFNKYPLTAPIAGAVLLVASGATIFWLINRNTFTPGTLPVGANLIPRDALMVLTLNTDVQEWQRLRSFGTSKSKANFDNFLLGLREQLFTQNGISYDQDIAPWVGPEVTIAQLSPQSELSTENSGEVPSSLSPQPMIAVLPIGDPLRARAVLAEPKALPNRQWTERQYKDIKIREAKPQASAPKPNAKKDSAAKPNTARPLGKGSKNTPLQIAVVENRVVVVTNSARSMNRAIDSLRDRGQSLSRTPGYAKALGQIQQPIRPFLTLYRNIPGSLNSAVQNFDRQLSKQQQEWIEQAQGWATVANLKEEGIELRNITWLKPGSKRRFAAKNNAKSLHSKIPRSALAMTSGGNFNQFWQDYRRDYTTYPVQLFDPNLLKRGIQESLGLNWDKDFLTWMKGEFAIAMVPMPGDAAKKMPIGIMALVKTNDRRAAEKTLKKLDDGMISRQRYQVTPGKFNNRRVVNWRDPISGTTVTHGWMNDNVAFFSLGSPVTGTFFPNVQRALTDEPKFRQTALDSLDDQKTDANGFFFLNVEDVLKQPKLPPLLSWLEAHRDSAEAVRAIGVNAVRSSDRTMRFNAFVQLVQGGSAGPLPTKPIKPAAKPMP